MRPSSGHREGTSGLDGGPIHFEVFGPTGHRAHGESRPFPSTRRFIDLLFGPDGAFAYLKDFAAPVNYDRSICPAVGTRRCPASSTQRYGLLITRDAGTPRRCTGGDYRSMPRPSIVFSGDIDAAGFPALGDRATGESPRVRCRGSRSARLPEVLHRCIPAEAIGELAARDEVDHLSLSHLSPAVDLNRVQVAASVAEHYHGRVTFATDGLRIAP